MNYYTKNIKYDHNSNSFYFKIFKKLLMFILQAISSDGLKYYYFYAHEFGVTYNEGNIT